MILLHRPVPSLGGDTLAALRRGILFAAVAGAILVAMGVAGSAGTGLCAATRLAAAPLLGADERLFVEPARPAR